VRRLIALVLAAGCASAGQPPGGPERHVPPEVVSVLPDSGQTNATVKYAQFQFDEVVSDRPSGSGTSLDQLFLISPRTGAPEVSWHRSRITVRPHGGFRPNTAYRITLLPGIADLRGNVRKDTRTILFSTGPTFPRFSIPGRVFDWVAQRPAVGAYVEGIARRDTSLVYLAAADSTGEFDLGPLDTGTYLVRTIIDQNANRKLDRNEKWDTLTVKVAETRPAIELLAIERDSVPPAFDNIVVVDSLTLRVAFDKALDPTLTVNPSQFRLQRADSTTLTISRVQLLSVAQRAQEARAADSTRRADSLRAASGIPAVRPAPGTIRSVAPPPPKPHVPAPDRAVVISLAPATPLVIGQTYRLSVHGIRNLLGNAQDISRTFNVPKPAPRDTTRKPPTDSTRRPPPARPRGPR
jgi:hypothetical protein